MSKVQITVAEIQGHLKNGKTRDDIKEMYSLKAKDIKTMFQHPDLKGKKTVKPYEAGFEFVGIATPTNDSPNLHQEEPQEGMMESATNH